MMKKTSQASAEAIPATASTEQEATGPLICFKNPLSPEELARQMSELAAMPDDQIDTSDIPPLPDSFFENAVRGKFYRPKTSQPLAPEETEARRKAPERLAMMEADYAAMAADPEAQADAEFFKDFCGDVSEDPES